MRLNKLVFRLIFGIVFLGGCTDENNVSKQVEVLKGTWNLKNLSGRFIGIDEDYLSVNIVWTFDPQNQTIVIDNNNQESTAFIFESGTYYYSITEINNQTFINIDNDEYGGFTISGNSLIIDQNKMSYGIGADGFILHFEK